MKLPSRQLVTQDQSTLVERANIPRSRFVNSWTHKTAFPVGYIVPIMVDEILPGDHMQYEVTAFLRQATTIFPILDSQRIDTFFFFVPNRLVWVYWRGIMGHQVNPGTSIAYTVPKLTLTAAQITLCSIYDYMGIPPITAGQDIQINVLPLRAYNLIYNEWFRDQNIQNSLTVQMDTGDLVTDFELRFRNKQHDYFTTALPWPQKFTAPSTPLSGVAPITGIGWDTTGVTNSGTQNVWETDVAGSGVNYTDWHSSVDTNKMIFKSKNTGEPQIYANLAAATGVSINAFRQAFMIQALLERDARGGTRYTEIIKSHFGVVSPDARQHRPEYIGGGSTPLQVTPIAQTAPSAGVPVGALGAAGTVAGQHRASYAATEHGFIIGLINVRTELTYQKGLHRMWTRSTRYDYYWPALAQLGEQAVLVQELYATGVAAADEAVFGYQERWHEYRMNMSYTTGLMRSTAAGTLDAWHLAQAFSSAPALNEAFIRDLPPQARVNSAGAAADLMHFFGTLLFKRTAVRPIPTYGTSALLGRF